MPDNINERAAPAPHDKDDLDEMVRGFTKLSPDVRKKIGYMIEGALLVSEAATNDKAS